MTCIDKLRELHPDWDDGKLRYYIEHHCPHAEYIRSRPLGCGSYGWEDSDDEDCEKCWNRKVYDDEKCNRYDAGLCLTGEDMRRLKDLAERTKFSDDKVVSTALWLYESCLNAVEESWTFSRGLEKEVGMIGKRE